MKKDEDHRPSIQVIDLSAMCLLDALWEIERRPQLWLSEPDITNLHSFIDGWNFGRQDKDDQQLIGDFDAFVAHKFNEGSSTSGWCKHIVLHAGDADSLDTFFNILREYTAQT